MKILVTHSEDANGMHIYYNFIDADTNNTIAKGRNVVKEYPSIEFEGNVFEFPNYPKFIERKEANFRYPIVHPKRRKNPGCYILKNGVPEIPYYQEIVRYAKGIGKTLGCEAYYIDEKLFYLFRVGFPQGNSHFYCLFYDDTTVAIIERHNYCVDNCKANIYVENEEFVKNSLIVCADVLINVPNSGGQDFSIDPSAGPYISRQNEERELFDFDFYNRVKNNSLDISGGVSIDGF